MSLLSWFDVNAFDVTVFSRFPNYETIFSLNLKIWNSQGSENFPNSSDCLTFSGAWHEILQLYSI